MKYSLVFLGDRNRKKILEDISSNLTLPFSAYQVVFLSNSDFKKENLSNINGHLNFKTLIYEKFSSSESMFESFIQNQNTGNIILFKESAMNLNFRDVNRMIAEQKKGSLLVVSKQNIKENWFVKTLKNIRNFLVKLFLNVSLFEDSADIILFDRLLIATMQEMPGKSAALSKVNAWTGISPKYISIDNQPKQKTSYRFKDFISVLILSIFFVGLLTTDIVLGVLKIKTPFILIIGIVALHLLTLISLTYIITKKLFLIKFGNLGVVPEANLLYEIDNFDE